MKAGIQLRSGFDPLDGLRFEVENTLVAGEPPGVAAGIFPAFKRRICNLVRHCRTPEAGDRQMLDATAAIAPEPDAILRTSALKEAGNLQVVRGGHPQMIIGGGRSNHRGNDTA